MGVLVLCGLALIGSAPSQAHSRPARASIDRAGTRGRWLIDAQGRTLLLHGLNMVAKLPPYLPASLGFGNDDAQFLAANGFTAAPKLIYPHGHQVTVHGGQVLRDRNGVIAIHSAGTRSVTVIVKP